jgi:catechol 2,3-dioxygenase-like lactoylglutathione lyase family enzyme
MPTIDRILETGLYVEDVDRAVAFYRDVLGLEVVAESPRLAAIHGGASTVLLLMLRGAMSGGGPSAGGWLPPHDAEGRQHFAFAVATEELPAWERHLAARGVAVESRVRWDRGGTSLYFRDPDGHLLELATPGVWSVY